MVFQIVISNKNYGNKDKESDKKAFVTLDLIERNILVLREQKVMIDSDLAKLYGVETRVLNQAVKRNLERFPEDFMFQLNKEEFENLKSQSVTSSSGNYGGRRKLPYVFTEQGVAMLSSVLNSERAVQVNIAIMRTFVNMRKILLNNDEVNKKLTKMKTNSADTTKNLRKFLRRFVC